MQVMQRFMAVVAIGGMLALVGCGGGEGDGDGGASSAIKATTPEKLLEKFAGAIDSGDREAFLACVKTSNEAEEKMAGAMFDMLSGITSLQKAVAAEYGEEAGPAFGGGGGPGGGAPMPTGTEWIKDAKIEVSGDKAAVSMPQGGETMPLVKSGEVWMIDMAESGQMPPAAELDKAVKMFEAMSSAIKEVKAMVGKEGVTAQQLEQELGQKMMAAMFGAMGVGEGMPMPPSPSE